MNSPIINAVTNTRITGSGRQRMTMNAKKDENDLSTIDLLGLSVIYNSQI
jgi:hypothetical protein